MKVISSCLKSPQALPCTVNFKNFKAVSAQEVNFIQQCVLPLSSYRDFTTMHAKIHQHDKDAAPASSVFVAPSTTFVFILSEMVIIIGNLMITLKCNVLPTARRIIL